MGIVLSTQRTTKALIRLRRCACWSASLLFAYCINRFSHDIAQLVLVFELIEALPYKDSGHVTSPKQTVKIKVVKWINSYMISHFAWEKNAERSLFRMYSSYVDLKFMHDHGCSPWDIRGSWGFWKKNQTKMKALTNSCCGMKAFYHYFILGNFCVLVQFVSPLLKNCFCSFVQKLWTCISAVMTIYFPIILK